MWFRVFQKYIFFIEPFTTCITLETPDTSVNRHVIISVLCFSEWFWTHGTAVSDACMFIHVHLVVTFVVVTFLAFLTEVDQPSGIVIGIT